MPNDSIQLQEPKSVATIKADRQISSIRFSPCGKFLLAAGRDASIRRWNTAAPAAPAESAAKTPELVVPELPMLKGHAGWVSSIAVHPVEPRLFSADTWGRIVAWPYADEAPQPQWNAPDAHDGWIRQLALSSDGAVLASCGMDRRIRLWSTVDGKPIRDLPPQPDDVYSLAFHPDGKSLVSGDLKGVVKHWNLADGTLTRELDVKEFYKLSYIQDVGGVRCLAFDTEGKMLAATGALPDSGGFVQAIPMIRFFNWQDGKEIQSIKLGEVADGFVHELVYHRDGFWIGVCSGQPGRGKYFFHRAGEAQPAFTGNKQMANCHSVAIHPSGDRFAVISNAGTFGQQKSMARQGVYPGNTSPIHLFDFVKKTV